jgi:hypothetical protein
VSGTIEHCGEARRHHFGERNTLIATDFQAVDRLAEVASLAVKGWLRWVHSSAQDDPDESEGMAQPG